MVPKVEIGVYDHDAPRRGPVVCVDTAIRGSPARWANEIASDGALFLLLQKFLSLWRFLTY